MNARLNRLRSTLGRPAPIARHGQRPLYARVLRLRHLQPGKLLCAVFFEGSVVAAMLLAFADLVSWWGVLATPVTVATMVKLNDVVAGRLPDPHAARRQPRSRSGEETAPADRVVTFDDPSTGAGSSSRADPRSGERPEPGPPPATAADPHEPDPHEPDPHEPDPHEPDTAVLGVVRVTPSTPDDTVRPRG